MSVDNSRIAKNTVYLYIRMLFVLGANFFAVRAVDITIDVDSERTPRGAMSEDLNAAPLQNQTSFQEGMLAYYVGGVNCYPCFGSNRSVNGGKRKLCSDGVLAVEPRPNHDGEGAVATKNAVFSAISSIPYTDRLLSGEVGVRLNSRPYYDQRVVVKFKADSEAPPLHGHLRIGESALDGENDSKSAVELQRGLATSKAGSEVTFLHERSRIGEFAFDVVYDNRFRLILQAVAAYNKV